MAHWFLTRVPRKLSGNRAVFGRVFFLTQYCGWVLAFCCMSLSFIRFVFSAVSSAHAPAGGYWAASKLRLLGVLPCLWLPQAPAVACAPGWEGWVWAARMLHSSRCCTWFCKGTFQTVRLLVSGVSFPLLCTFVSTWHCRSF